tara:strand:- start:8455 stop:9834 length:1380 start_codon:yes stop_codon:yes gene_type:complete
MSFNDRNWRKLLIRIEEESVIPIIGPELLQVKINDLDKPQPLYNLIADELLKRFEISRSKVQGEINLKNVSHAVTAQFGPQDYKDDLYYEIRDIVNSFKFELPKPLLQLAEITHFSMYVSICFVPLMEQALNQSKFSSQPLTKSFTYSSKKEVVDLPDTLNIQEVVLFNLFGTVSSRQDYVVSEEDELEFVHRLQSYSYQPKKLFDAMGSKDLLFLGCNLPDWLMRFFVCCAKGDKLFTHGAPGLVADNNSNQDKNLVHFFNRNKTSVFNVGNSVDFVNELHQRWKEAYPNANQQQGAPKPIEAISDMKPDSIFLSYANEDELIAQKIKNQLEEAGLYVWMDKAKLKPGDDYRDKILRNIEHVAFFIPVLSNNTLSEEKRFFRLEWHKSLEVLQEWPVSHPFIQPLVYDDIDVYSSPSIPKQFTEKHVIFCQRSELVSQDFVANLKARIRQLRRSRLVC